MIVLDTNVLSECMRSRPAPQVLAWLDAQPPASLWLSAISHAEIALGLALMPQSKRQAQLAQAAAEMFDSDFAGRCLPFHADAAEHYARIVAVRTRMGRPISVEDAQIAAIALAHGASLATRNLADFTNIEALTLINPWDFRA